MKSDDIEFIDDAPTHWGWHGVQGHLVIRKPKLKLRTRIYHALAILKGTAVAVKFHEDKNDKVT